MREKLKKSLDKGGKSSALLIDSKEAFDSLLHDFLIAKLHPYGFEIDSLRLIHSYLVGRKQRVKIDSEYNTWQEILFREFQVSILGPLPFTFTCATSFLLSDQLA